MGESVSAVPESSWGGRPALREAALSHGQAADWIQSRKGGSPRMPAFTPLCFLSVASCLLPCLLPSLPCQGGLHPQTLSQNKAFLP